MSDVLFVPQHHASHALQDTLSIQPLINASSAMSVTAFNVPLPTSAHSAPLTSQSPLLEVIVKHVISQTVSIVMDLTTATFVLHHILLSQEDAFSAVSVDALFAKQQMFAQLANPEIQPTTEQFV